MLTFTAFLLQSKGSELVSLETELKFLDSYVYLIRSRFGENIELAFDIKVDQENSFLPPLTLQMLFENGIKHNAIGKDHRLCFRVFTDENHYLVVTNNIIKKRHSVDSYKTGLQNIMNRYLHFTQKKVIINDDDAQYTVKVPLLEIEEV